MTHVYLSLSLSTYINLNSLPPVRDRASNTLNPWLSLINKNFSVKYIRDHLLRLPRGRLRFSGDISYFLCIVDRQVDKLHSVDSSSVSSWDLGTEWRVTNLVRVSIKRQTTTSPRKRMTQRGSCGINLWGFSGWSDRIAGMRSGLLASCSPSLPLVSVHISQLSRRCHSRLVDAKGLHWMCLTTILTPVLSIPEAKRLTIG